MVDVVLVIFRPWDIAKFFQMQCLQVSFRSSSLSVNAISFVSDLDHLK